MEHNHVVYDSDVHFLIDPTTRKIRTETSRKTTVIQFDHNSERFTFDIPRYIEGHDMSKCDKVEMHYLNVDARTKDEKRGVYVSDDLAISETDSSVVSCSWLISSNATQLVGSLNFIVRYCCVEGGIVTYAWNTAVASVAVSTGIDGGEFVATEYADVLETWKAELFNAGYINASTMQNDLSVLKSRMDTFASLKDGSTTGDAELQDLRVGADGATYDSAGAAIREQIRGVSYPLCVSPNETMVIPNATTGKYVAKDTGIVTSGDSTLYCTDAIKIPFGAYEIHASGRGFPSIMPSAAFYDTSGIYISGYNQPNAGEYVIETIPVGSVYVRFCTYNPDGNTPISYKFHTMERLRKIERDVFNVGAKLPNVDNRHCNVVKGITSYKVGKFISNADTNGTILNNANYILIDDYFEIEAEKTYNFVCGEPKIFSSTTHEWVFYDENKLVIEPPTLKGNGVTSPKNAAYLRFALCVVGGGVVTLDNFAEYADKLVICENPPAMAKPFTDSFVTRMNISPKKWVGIGDSLTEGNNGRAEYHYFDYVCAETGLDFVNMGFSGSGYRNESSGGKAFWRRVKNMDIDADVITIFGGINDCIFGVSGGEIGTADDTGTDTVCGCVNTTIDNILSLYHEHCPLGIISPIPAFWVDAEGDYQFGEQMPMDEGCRVSLFCKQLEIICKRRGIPFLDLFHTSNLRPWVKECRNKYFSCDNSPDGDGLHLNSDGHRLIYRRIMQFVESICN